MSEMKCPVCGERLTGDIDGVVICWSGCSFRCGGYALPRIAAAMELAKLVANRSKGLVFRPEDELHAIMKINEVFNG